MINRRNFLFQMTAVMAGVAVGFGGLQRRALAFTADATLVSMRADGFGQLLPTAAQNTGEIFLALPKGFNYKVLGRVGSLMSDGNKTPALHDGMACFTVGNELRLIRNHEISNGEVPKAASAIGINPYDVTAPGGTTTLVINPKTREVVKDFVSLSGTLVNCAGGKTPWGSWISCEETTLGQGIRSKETGKKTGGYPKPHGYCFEVFASANGAVETQPLKAMGRFKHEAVAVDKHTGTLYLTEDAKTAGFYRFIPQRKQHLSDGGELQMLKIKGKEAFDLRQGLKIGQRFEITWVTIYNPDPLTADFDEIAVYKQGLAQGGATFSRLEGAYADDRGRIYFVSTDGGDLQGGQIWRYERKGKKGGVLTLVFESPSRAVLDMPDNICLKPNSELLFICEDSDYKSAEGTPENYLRILAPNGKIADFAKNITTGFEKSEFAGSTFSEDGKTLFVNLQAVGVTLAIWGDWDSFKDHAMKESNSGI
jgi:secreted PhoX family phosphatase